MEKTLSYGSNVYPGAQVDMFSGMKAGFKDPFFYLKPARQNNRSIVLHKSAEFSLEPFPILTEYYGAAEPPVQCGVSHLSGLTEPSVYSYSA